MESPGPGHSERRRADIADKQAPQMSLSNTDAPGQLDDRTLVQRAFLNEAQCVPHDRRSIVCRTIRIVPCRGIACCRRNEPAEIGHRNGRYSGRQSLRLRRSGVRYEQCGTDGPELGQHRLFAAVFVEGKRAAVEPLHGNVGRRRSACTRRRE